jgi:hypothetical protein
LFGTPAGRALQDAFLAVLAVRLLSNPSTPLQMDVADVLSLIGTDAQMADLQPASMNQLIVRRPVIAWHLGAAPARSSRG